MGRDKLLLEVGGTPLVRRVRDALATRCEEILLVGGRPVIADGVRWVPDERPGRQGPLAGMEAGLAAAKNRLVFVAAGDMPFLSPALIAFLIERLGSGASLAAVPRYRDTVHPLCAAYDRDALPVVRAALDGGVRAMREFLMLLGAVDYVEEELERFGDPDRFLMNVNLPEDLMRAKGEDPD